MGLRLRVGRRMHYCKLAKLCTSVARGLYAPHRRRRRREDEQTNCSEHIARRRRDHWGGNATRRPPARRLTWGRRRETIAPCVRGPAWPSETASACSILNLLFAKYLVYCAFSSPESDRLAGYLQIHNNQPSPLTVGSLKIL